MEMFNYQGLPSGRTRRLAYERYRLRTYPYRVPMVPFVQVPIRVSEIKPVLPIGLISPILLTESQVTTSKTEEFCSICHETINVSDIIRKLNFCKHFFHLGCIDQWFTSKDTCPMCRHMLN